jgi:hypothetical protein
MPRCSEPVLQKKIQKKSKKKIFLIIFCLLCVCAGSACAATGVRRALIRKQKRAETIAAAVHDRTTCGGHASSKKIFAFFCRFFLSCVFSLTQSPAGSTCS